MHSVNKSDNVRYQEFQFSITRRIFISVFDNDKYNNYSCDVNFTKLEYKQEIYCNVVSV